MRFTLRHIELPAAALAAALWSPAAAGAERSLWPPDRYGALSIGGRALLDGTFANEDPTRPIAWDAELRSVRVISKLDTENLRGRFQLELSEGRVELPVFYLRWRRRSFELNGGLARPPNSLEARTGVPRLTFLERARFTQAFGFSRQFGADIRAFGERWTSGFGVYRGGLDDGGDLRHWTIGAHGGRYFRAGDGDVFLGLSARHRRTADGGRRLRYRARSASRSTPRRIDTGRFARSDGFIGVEAQARIEKLTLTGEWGVLRPFASDESLDRRPTFHGGYVGLDYQLVGTPARIRPSRADRRPPDVAYPISGGGAGDLRASLRFDHVDLSSGDVRGGLQNVIQAALVWRPEGMLKVTAEYARAGVAQSDPGPVEHAVTLRAQILL